MTLSTCRYCGATIRQLDDDSTTGMGQAADGRDAKPGDWADLATGIDCPGTDDRTHEPITNERRNTVTTPSQKWVHVEMTTAEGIDSPRDDYGNLGVLVLRNKRLRLPAEGDLVDLIDHGLTNLSLRGVTRWLKVCHGATVVLPVFGYDHGQVRFKAMAEPEYPFADQWDAGLAGLIYDTPATHEVVGVPDMQAEQIGAILTAEVDAYDVWANNEMWRWEIREGTEDQYEVLDSCGGYYSEEEATEVGNNEMSAQPEPTREQATHALILQALRRARASAQSAVTLTTAAIDTYWATVVDTDIDNPMHVAEGAPHWHVAHGADDVEDHVDTTVFGALHFVADGLEREAEHAQDIFESQAEARDFEEAFHHYGNAQRWGNLAENAERLHRQATLPTWLRAPLYSGPDEAKNRRLLMQAAVAHVGRIHDGGPDGLRIRECAEAQCAPSDDI